MRELGVGTGAVRTIAGATELIDELERRLADFKHVEAVLTLQSGFTANSGVIPAITGDARPDRQRRAQPRLDHRWRPAFQGIAGRLPASRRRRPGERAARSPRRRRCQRAYRTILVITDGVFSMDGDIAPLADICDVADRYEAAVMVDDAHASGVLGRNGRGTVDHFDLHGRVDIQVGTLSKAVGVDGRLHRRPPAPEDYLTQRCRTFLFSTSQPPAVAAACIAAIDVLESGAGAHRASLGQHALLQGGAEALGFDTGSRETPITPVIAGDENKAQQLAAGLFDEGVFAHVGRLPDRRAGSRPACARS